MHKRILPHYLALPVSSPPSGRTLIPPTTCPHCGGTDIRATLATEHVQYYLCDTCASVWNVARTRSRQDALSSDNSRNTS